MIAFDHGLIAYTERYLTARPVCADYANTLRARIARLCEWAQTDVPIHAITAELVNEWLAELAAGGMKPWTLSGYRSAVLAVWNHAFLIGDNDNAPLRVRTVKKPRMLIEAYTHQEIRMLLDRAAKLRELHIDGRRAADFWTAALLVGYCCGARRGDILELEWSMVSPDGRLTFIQRKTGYDATARLSADAMKAARKLGKSGRVLPYPYRRNWFTVQFGRLRDSAKVTRGTFKWVRRSAGSYAESQQPGSGAALLGHRDGRVFKRHYEDRKITAQEPIQPPPIT